jgi:hypothetical protein
MRSNRLIAGITGPPNFQWGLACAIANAPHAPLPRPASPRCRSGKSGQGLSRYEIAPPGVPLLKGQQTPRHCIH